MTPKVSFLLCLWISHIVADPCRFTGNFFYSRDAIFSCFDSIPFDERIKETTLNALQKAMPLFTFLDIASHPPPDFPLERVNLYKEFQRINTSSYQGDFDFHMDLTKTFLKLKDAHTKYVPPACYSNFIFYQPLPMVSFMSDREQIIGTTEYINPVMLEHWSEKGIDLRQYAGAIVLELQGITAMAYIAEWSQKELGYSKDPGTRFELALRIPSPFNAFLKRGEFGYFSARNLGASPFPSESDLTYKLKLANGTIVTVTFPWEGLSSRSIINTAQFNSICASSSTKSPFLDFSSSLNFQLENTTSTFNFQLENQLENQLEIVPILNDTDSGIGFWQVDEKTMVLYIDTWEPPSQRRFFDSVNRGILAGISRNLTRLILDMTLNGGGDICLGRQFLKYLFPNKINWGPTDVPVSDLAVNLTRSSMLYEQFTFWTPQKWANQSNVQYTDDSWLVPGHPKIRGGFHRNFSEIIHVFPFGCGDPPFQIPNSYFPGEILVLSRGFCGSTCALVADHLNLYEKVKTLTIGGFHGRPQGYTSFPGLQVLDSGAMYDQMDSVGQNTFDQDCTECLSPRRLLTSATYRMTAREIYGPQDNEIPLEYKFVPADFRLMKTRDTAERSQLLWKDALQFFGK
eukprot:TRINITY_DN2911_c0_g1_i1.p1 TRINITY_DN2911_c0_g1~~TRINITY_DN2911_c0_g1_i1.p1  ORF type:complete len:629 (-),score=162.68 TRINITY_DN2911_c0_g1_i1:176-2062(-)